MLVLQAGQQDPLRQNGGRWHLFRASPLQWKGDQYLRWLNVSFVLFLRSF